MENHVNQIFSTEVNSKLLPKEESSEHETSKQRRFSLQETEEKERRHSFLMRHRGSEVAINVADFQKLLQLSHEGDTVTEEIAALVTCKFEVLVLGAFKVGKSSIVNQFLYNKFLEDYHPTVEEFYTQSFPMSGQEIELRVLDTSGSHEFPAMKSLNIGNADGFLLVLSIDDATSWDEVRAVYTEIVLQRGKDVPIVVVANKADLSPTCKVNLSEIRNVVEGTWKKQLMEISAWKDDDVIAVFKQLFRQVPSGDVIFAAINHRRESFPHYNVSQS